MTGLKQYQNAGFFSKLTFWWIVPLMKLGIKKEIEDIDLPELEAPENSRNILVKMHRAWQDQIDKSAQSGGKRKPSLLYALWHTSSTLCLVMFALLTIDSAVCVLQTLALGRLIWYFNGEENGIADGLTWAGILTALTLLENELHHYFYFWGWRLGLRLQVSTLSLLYSKCLKLQIGTLSQISVGYVLNLATNDIARFQAGGVYFLYIITAPLLALTVLYIGIQQIGISFVAGWSVLILLIPLQMKMASLFGSTRQKVAEKTDQRMKVTKETFSGASLMKLNGLEHCLMEMIKKARALEFKGILKANYLRAINESIFFITPSVLSLVTFLTFLAMGNSLNPHVVFTVVALLNLLQTQLTKFMAEGIQTSSEMWISLRRLEYFLNLPEVFCPEIEREIEEMDPKGMERQGTGFKVGFKSQVYQEMDENRPLLQGENKDYHAIDIDVPKEESVHSKDEDPTSSFRISMKKASFKWEKNRVVSETGHTLVLKGLDLEIKDGEFVAFVGSVGSAKTSLLMAILNEMNQTGPDFGDFKVQGKVAYASQEPWIMSGTIRSNILFGKKYEKERYDQVVARCSLLPDFASFECGDLTTVGDNGAGLSGGQRARIGLARLAYNDEADIFLMDDPLSAVDPAVGRQLFEQVACEHLASRTRVLVTHQIQYLQHESVSKIYILDNGNIKAQGTFKELVNQGMISAEYLKKQEEKEVRERAMTEAALTELEASGSSSMDTKRRASSVSFIRSVEDPVALQYGKETDAKNVDKEAMDEEEIATGLVKLRVFLQYIQAMGGFSLVFLALLSLAMAQGFVMYISAFLAKWSETPSEVQHHSWYAQRLIVLVAMATILSVVASTSNYTLLNRASRKLHDKMLHKVIRAPIGFFNSNPLGRIMNRFSKDVGHMDDLLPFTIFDFLQCSVMTVGAILFIGLANPFIFLTLPVLALLFIGIRNYSQQSMRMLKRMEAAARSPVYSLISETLTGLTTIRAFTQQIGFYGSFFERTDANSRACYNWLAVVRWLGFWLDMLVVLLVGASTFICVYVNESFKAIDGALLGAALTYMILLAGLFQWAVRQSSEVENQMISVERVLEFCDIDQEPALASDPEFKPPAEWPQTGRIQVSNVSARYDVRSPPVLSNLNFEIQGGERVGIVGRTGAGKSSFVSVLFRLIEAMEGGTLTIDGVDISEIGLHDLRLKMSVIPQTPFLFSGTIKQNLDPFDAIQDDECFWTALEQVQLAAEIHALPEGLNAEVGEGGSTWSVGQRQLLCLARALLAQNRIIVMDEATANVDVETEAFIQQALETKFSRCTVLMIAHRLETVINCDKVLVLGDGALVEFGTPCELLEKEADSPKCFASMVKETGPQQSQKLRRLAKENQAKRMQQIEVSC